MSKRRLTRPGVSFFAFQDIITAVVGIFVLIVILLALELVQRVEANQSGPAQDLTAVRQSIAAMQAESERLKQEIDSNQAAATGRGDINAFNHADKIAELEQQRADLSGRIEQETKRQESLSSRIENAKAAEVKLLAEAAELEPQREELDKLKAEQAHLQAEMLRVRTINTPVYRDVAENGREVTLITLSENSIKLRDARTQQRRDWRGDDRLRLLNDWLVGQDLNARHIVLIVQPGGTTDFAKLKVLLTLQNAVFGFQLAGEHEHYQLGFEIL